MRYTSKNKRFSITTEMKQFCIIPTFGFVYKIDYFTDFKYGFAFMFANVNCVFRFAKKGGIDDV